MRSAGCALGGALFGLSWATLEAAGAWIEQSWSCCKTGAAQRRLRPTAAAAARSASVGKVRAECLPLRHSPPCRVLRVAASSEPQQLRGGEAMALPLDYYKMLDVSGVCSRDSLARALEKCAAAGRVNPRAVARCPAIVGSAPA